MMTDAKTKLAELEACMFGTLVPRDPSERVARMKRAPDGWRHGISRAYESDGKIYGDNIGEILKEPKGTDLVVRMFETLRAPLAEAIAAAELAAKKAAEEIADKYIAAGREPPAMGERKECCRIEANLVPRPDMERPDLSVMVCRVCRCRHFELTVDVASLRALPAAVAAVKK